jgi:hypothetical protein
METIRTIVVLAGLGLLYNGYVSSKTPVAPPSPNVPVNPDDPHPIPVGPGSTIQIISKDDVPPSAPINPQIAAASSPIRQILAGNPQDALKLARTFTGWSELIGGNLSLKTVSEFQTSLQEATGILFARHKMAGKYGLVAPINATMNASFAASGLVEKDGIAAGPWTPAASQAAKQALDAIAYQCFQAFIDGTVKTSPQASLERTHYDGTSGIDYQLCGGWSSLFNRRALPLLR